MKASEIVTQLSALLPQRTDKFTRNVGVSSLVRAGSVITATTDDAHDLAIGDSVAITGAVTLISIGTLTRSGVEGTLVTDTDHDLTNPVADTITISGAVEAVFNGSFPVVNVDNRRTIRFTMADSGATTATGSPVLEGAESALRDYNKTYAVASIPTPTTFTFAQTDTTLLDPIGTIEARMEPRITAGVNPARATDAYTEQADGNLWLFVALEDVTASKSRMVRSDAIDNLHATDNFRQQVIQPFSVYIFIPSTNEIAQADARDTAEDLFLSICQSLLASTLDSGLSVSDQGVVQFVTHGTFATNSAVYVHGYSFQQVVDLYEGDTVGPDLDVAFRNLDFSMAPELPELQTDDTPTLDATLDLDDVPL